jgi:hypothetical protein
MNRFLLILISLLTAMITFAARDDADKWRVMVQKLDVFESSSPDSHIIGSYKKYDCPEVIGPRVHKMVGVSYDNATGYVFEDGMLKPGYMPGSSKGYEAAVEDAIVIQRNGGVIPDGYTLKGCYDIWENDNENLPVISEDDLETPIAIETINEDTDPHIVHEAQLWERILMWIIAISSILCTYGAIFRFNWSAKLLLIIAIIELIYFVFAPNALFFTRFKTFDDGEIRRVLDSGWVYGCFLLQIFAGFRQWSSRKQPQIVRKLPVFMILATGIVFALRFGVSAFFIGLIRDSLKLVLSVVGFTILGIALYGLFKDGLDSKSTPESSDSDSSDSKRHGDACCINCRHISESGSPMCTKYNCGVDLSDYCSSHIWR